MTERINRNWREQAKAVLMTPVSDASASATIEFPSVWQAALHIAAEFGCKHETAKKEIRRAIRTGGKRYGAVWKFKDYEQQD